MHKIRRSNDYKRKWAAVRRALKRRVMEPTTDDDSNDDLPMYQAIHPEHAAGQERDSDTSSRYDDTNDEAPIEDENNHEDVDNAGLWNDIDRHVILSSDSETEPDVLQLSDDLISWVNKFQVRHNAVDELLQIPKKHNHDHLPSTARTLLKTTRDVQIQMKSGMEYVNLGLLNTL